MLRITPKTPEELKARQENTLEEETMAVRYYNENYYIPEQTGRVIPEDVDEDAPERQPTYNYWYCADCGILYEPDDLVVIKYGPLLPPEEGEEEPPARTTQAYCTVRGTRTVRVPDPETGVPRQVIEDIVCEEPLQTSSPENWLENFNIEGKLLP